MRAPWRPYTVALVGASLFSACNKPHAIVVDPPKSDCGANAPATAKGKTSDPESVLFYRDILPILESNVRGANYKCTVCHAEYKDPAGVANVAEVERIVASLEAGRMPRAGDRVPQDKIDLIKRWRLTGLTIEGPDELSTDTLGTNSSHGSKDCEPRT